jgi:TPR repeat protein
VKKDDKKAYAWYKKAAKLGKMEAHLNLARCYLYGIGVRTNTRKAVPILMKLAASCCEGAVYELIVFFNSLQNYNISLFWIIIARKMTMTAKQNRFIEKAAAAALSNMSEKEIAKTTGDAENLSKVMNFEDDENEEYFHAVIKNINLVRTLSR